MTKNDEWWASLTVAQKSQIATRAKSQENPNQSVGAVGYPACSEWWNTLNEEQKGKWKGEK